MRNVVSFRKEKHGYSKWVRSISPGKMMQTLAKEMDLQMKKDRCNIEIWKKLQPLSGEKIYFI